MVFGDIVEPSTRALLYEEDECITEENLDWMINPEIPTTIEALLISETPFTNKILQSVFLQKKKPIAQTKGRIVTIYNYEDSKFIAICTPTPNSSVGHITEVLLPWIKAAENCYSIITLPTANYQNHSMPMEQRPFCLLRMLATNHTTDEEPILPRLETPNLITGIGANCLSYCSFDNKQCSLFIGYIDYAPIDSVNSKPFIDLLTKLCYDSHGKVYKLTDKLPENNLYI